MGRGSGDEDVWGGVMEMNEEGHDGGWWMNGEGDW
jgi:hypothetical protein